MNINPARTILYSRRRARWAGAVGAVLLFVAMGFGGVSCVKGMVPTVEVNDTDTTSLLDQQLSPADITIAPAPLPDVPDVYGTDVTPPPALDMPAPTVDVAAPELDPYMGDPLAAVVATELVAAWLNTDDPDWPDVTPQATDELAARLATADPRNIPEGQVDGWQHDVIGDGYSEMLVGIGDGRTVRVVLSLNAAGWQATQLLPE